MKKILSSIVAVLGLTVLLSPAQAANSHFHFSFSVDPGPTYSNTLTFALPSPDFDPNTSIFATGGLTITSTDGGAYGVAPTTGPDIFTFYLGTAANPFETKVSSIGTAFSTIPGNPSMDTTTQQFSSSSTVAGLGYTELTVVTEFTLANATAGGTGSFDLSFASVPEPSTSVLLVGGLGGLLFLALRRRNRVA